MTSQENSLNGVKYHSLVAIATNHEDTLFTDAKKHPNTCSVPKSQNLCPTSRNQSRPTGKDWCGAQFTPSGQTYQAKKVRRAKLRARRNQSTKNVSKLPREKQRSEIPLIRRSRAKSGSVRKIASTSLLVLTMSV